MMSSIRTTLVTKPVRDPEPPAGTFPGESSLPGDRRACLSGFSYLFNRPNRVSIVRDDCQRSASRGGRLHCEATQKCGPTRKRHRDRKALFPWRRSSGSLQVKVVGRSRWCASGARPLSRSSIRCFARGTPDLCVRPCRDGYAWGGSDADWAMKWSAYDSPRNRPRSRFSAMAALRRWNP